MNEEDITVPSSSNEDLQGSDPLQTSLPLLEEVQIANEEKVDGEEKIEANPIEIETEENGTDDAADPEDLCLSAASVPAPDPDFGASFAADTRDQLERLQNELTHLREQIALQQELTVRVDRECSEFGELYPNIPLNTLPDSVWQDVEKGVPLAAAFALAERRRTVLQKRAEESNLSNLARTVGGVAASDSEYFSSDEVRAMSREEVRKNYSKIMQSMKRWS